MRDILIRLIDILSEQRDLYRRLIVLSEQKKEVIVTRKIAVLDKIVRDEQEPLLRLKELERRRHAQLEALSVYVGKPADDITVSDLSGVCPEDLLDRLHTVQQELLAALKTQMVINDVNKKLLESRLEYLNFMMSTNAGDYTNAYNAGAGEAAKSNRQTSRIIDLGV